MRPILLLIPITLGISPLAAQLTPAQRQAQETKVANEHLSERLQAEWTQRALDGDPSAYGGVTARNERYYLTQRLGFGDWARRAGNNGVSPDSQPWFTISARPAPLRALRQSAAVQVTAKADQAQVLTIATLNGGPARTLMIRAAVVAEYPTNGWSRTGAVTADQNGRYLIDLPPLAAGIYDLQIEVYDPSLPDAPSSESRNRLMLTK